MGWYERLFGGGVTSISPQEAYQRLQRDPMTVIVDVRQPSETASGSVPDAVLIPLTEFAGRLAELPRDRPILTICRSSHRSPLAARQLKRAGYNVTNVSGGTMAWEKAGLPFGEPTQSE
jgi:rhodanese-related sulfurtransferase